MLSIEDQETFMHSIYDIIHIGISVKNLIHRFNHLKEKYGEDHIVKILNSKMKDEKYSDEMVYPLIKVIYTQPSINNNLQDYYSKKLEVLRIFEKAGVNMKVVCGKVPERLANITKYAPLFLDQINKDEQLIDLYYSNKLIDNNIRDYLRQFDRIEIEI
jgi:hypothetical protein